jgi:hypothetical protein
MLQPYQEFQITNQEQLTWASEQLLAVKRKYKGFDEQEKSATKPINDSLKTIRGWFRAVKDPLAQLEHLLKNKIGSYEIAQRAEQRKALVAATESFQRGDQSTGLALLAAVPERAVTPTTGVSSRAVVKFEILDPALVPCEFCSPDPAKLRAAVALGGKDVVIAGVRVYEEMQISGRVG